MEPQDTGRIGPLEAAHMCAVAERNGLRHTGRKWNPQKLACIDGRTHCAHGDPVRCCTCGAFEDAFLEAVRVAAHG